MALEGLGPITLAQTIPDKRKPKPINPGGRTATSARMVLQSEGMLVRFSPVVGVTPAGALDRNLWLPAVLGDWQVDEDALHNEYDTLTNGQFSMGAMGKPSDARRLRTGSTDTLTMDFDPRWIVATGQDPEWIRARMSEILRSHKPVHMLISYHPNAYSYPEYDGDVTFRTFSKLVRSSEPDTRYHTLTWKDWRDPSVKRRTHGSGRKKGISLPATVALRATDTLNSLSYEYYGSYAWWREIRNANGIPSRFGAKTPLVKLGGHYKVGAKIKIPLIREGLGPITSSSN